MSPTSQNSALPFVLAVTGGSGSGKSHLAAAISERLGESCLHLTLDDFYRDCSHLSETERKTKNYDVPAAIDWATFFKTLGLLQAGRPAYAPLYDFEHHVRRAAYQHCQPQNTLIVDGLWLFHCDRLRQLFHHRVYVDCPPETRLKRRLERDAATRSRNPDSVVKQFNQQTQPMEQKWVLPQKQLADTVVQSPFEGALITDLVDRLRLSL